MIRKYTLGQVRIHALLLADLMIFIEQCIAKNRSGYICFMNTRTAYLANSDKEYCRIQNNSLLTLPDGMPLVWIAKRKGYHQTEKISGKDFMDSIFSVSAKNGYSHYFYGSTDETITKIKQKLKDSYPGIAIAGAVSPPFQHIDDFDLDDLAADVNKVRPTFFWCGLGAPKQEILISRLQEKLDFTLCAGVGLAFEYFGGTIKRAPSWMRNTGLEWLYRLSQQPRNIPRAIRPFLWVIKQYMVSARKHE
jgi:N-acetylglucosaminyldiphosphoundecaprenol N-acetyl-beta-D-mannosaminyltransferase